MNLKDDVKKRQVGGNHYKKKIEPWDVIDVYNLNYWEGNAVKYILRDKDPEKRIEDLEKTIHYLEFEIARLKEEAGKPIEVKHRDDAADSMAYATPITLRGVDISMEVIKKAFTRDDDVRTLLRGSAWELDKFKADGEIVLRHRHRYERMDAGEHVPMMEFKNMDELEKWVENEK